MEDKQMTKPFVVDMGTQSTKVGFSEPLSGERFPQHMVPTLLGYPKLVKITSAHSQKNEIYYGLDALKRSPLLALKYPIEHGIILDWEEATLFLENLFDTYLHSEVSQLTGGLLMTEAPLNPKINREKLAEIMFEHFQVPKLQLSMQALNALYTEGLTTGLVLECGEGLSTCVPVVDGYVVSSAITRLDIGGRDVNEYLMALLQPKITFTTTFEREFVRDIKEQFCMVRPLGAGKNAQEEQGRKKYCLPDGKNIELVEEQYQAPEILFNTALIGREENSIQDLVYQTLEKCELDSRSSLASHLILAGGSTTFKGFTTRFSQELARKCPVYSINIVEKPYRRYMSWMGASILASLNSFQPKWITEAEYREVGVNIIHKKSLFL